MSCGVVRKRRRKVLFGRALRKLGEVFHALARQKECQIIEGHLLPDHVHMCMAIPPKYPVASAIGFLKGKSAIAMARLCGKERNFTGEHHLNQGANAVRVAVRRHRGEAKSRASLGPCEVEDLRMYRTSTHCAFMKKCEVHPRGRDE